MLSSPRTVGATGDSSLTMTSAKLGAVESGAVGLLGVDGQPANSMSATGSALISLYRLESFTITSSLELFTQ